MQKKIKDSKIVKLHANKGDLKGEVNLVWDPVQNATGYIVQAAQVNGKHCWKQVDIVTRSHCTVTGLRSGCEYKFRAAAVSVLTENLWSSTVKEKAS